MYIYIYIYIYICACGSVCVYIYKNLFYAISYTLIVVNISFFHRLMLFKVQSGVNLNGTNRKEDRTQQKKKSFTD